MFDYVVVGGGSAGAVLAGRLSEDADVRVCLLEAGGNGRDLLMRVHGVEGLRVIDASVMPTLIGGNTNAPVIMMAEKVVAEILGQASP